MPPIVLTLIAGWLAGWIVKQVPQLDPAQAHEVAHALVNNGWSLVITAFLVGWRFFRRPGDVPKDQAPPRFEVPIPPRREP